MLRPPQLHHQNHQSHLAVRQLQDNRFQVAANRMTKSMLSYMVRWCCFRMEGVRLAVRYRSDLHSGDPIRWSKGHENRWWMDLGDHLLKDHLSHWLMDHANRW